MQDKIKITEEDIFKFVFNPESLPKIIFDYLTQNQKQFASEILFCKEMNSESSDSTNKQADEILERVNLTSIVELYASNGINDLDHGIKLAAASFHQTKTKANYSFSDPEMNFLIRLVNANSQCLLYFFTNDIEAKYYKIKFFPSENEYEITDPTKPIEIIEEKEILKIVITY